MDLKRGDGVPPRDDVDWGLDFVCGYGWGRGDGLEKGFGCKTGSISVGI